MDLLQRAGNGEEAALVEFASRWWPVILRFAWGMLGNPSQAKAVTEEVLCAALDPAGSPLCPCVSMLRQAVWLSLARRRAPTSPSGRSKPVFREFEGMEGFDRVVLLLRDVERRPGGGAAGGAGRPQAVRRARAHP